MESAGGAHRAHRQLVYTAAGVETLVALTTVNDPGAEEAALASAARRRVSYATLWLAFVVPLPITCVLARAPLPGTLFLGSFIGIFARLTTFQSASAPIELAWFLLGTKVADVIVGLVITRMRRRATHGETPS